MLRFLKWAVQFVDRKWPDVVVVRKDDYDALIARLVKVEGAIARMETTLGMMGIGSIGKNPFER